MSTAHQALRLGSVTTLAWMPPRWRLGDSVSIGGLDTPREEIVSRSAIALDDLRELASESRPLLKAMPLGRPAENGGQARCGAY